MIMLFFYIIIFNSNLQTNMKLRDVLMTTLENTPIMREKQISSKYEQLKTVMMESEAAENSAKEKRENEFLTVYKTLYQKMSSELMSARKKYQELDKQKMKEEKCLKLAESINIFREECYLLKQELKQTQKALKAQKQKEQVLKRQTQAFQVSISRTKTRAQSEKKSYSRLQSELKQIDTSKVFTRNTRRSFLNRDSRTEKKIQQLPESRQCQWKNRYIGKKQDKFNNTLTFF